jgi:hypothetical protein
MVLADLGAEIIRLERVNMPAARAGIPDRRIVLTRARPSASTSSTSRESNWCSAWSNTPTPSWRAFAPVSWSGSDSVPPPASSAIPALSTDG